MSALGDDEQVRMAEFFDRLTRKIEDIESGHDICGLSEREIESVRTAHGVAAFPAYYEEFLRRMGTSAGALWVGTDAFYPRLLEVRSWIVELLAENGVSQLMGEDAVAIATHQGYQAYWLESSAADDPPAMTYIEGDREPRKRWNSFSELLCDELAPVIALRERWKGQGGLA
jgi:SMI1/KNR4 family protein SUKH-1